MAKDTFYFSHDYNARNDDKIKKLIRKHGMRGYGIFWAIVEDLYNNANALRLDCEGIAYDMREDCEIIKSVIHDFGLFTIDGDIFGSISIGNRLDERNSKSKKARENAHKRWKNIGNDATAMPSHSDRNAIKEVKERKGEKEETNFRATISSEYQKLSIEDCRKKYEIENVAKREQIAMNLKVNQAQIIILHDIFDKTLKTKVSEKLFKDYTEHFANWVNKLSTEQVKEKIKASIVVEMPKKLTFQERYGQ